MTAVYRTYLDASELLPPLAYFFLFMLGGFAAAFAALAAAPRRHRRSSPCATCRAACERVTAPAAAGILSREPTGGR